MNSVRFRYCVVQIFIASTVLGPVECGRKYDVYAESMKLFGEDLSVVLKRFRRSSEYLTILNTKVKDLKQSFDDMVSQIQFSFVTDELRDRLNKSFNSEVKEPPPLRHSRAHRTGEDLTGNVTTTTLSPVEQLDHHELLNSRFTVAEKNSFKDIGFEVVGDAIHKLIASMGQEEDDSEIKSTRMPSGKITSTTTEHATVHEVTSPSTYEENGPVRFRNKFSNKMSTISQTKL